MLDDLMMFAKANQIIEIIINQLKETCQEISVNYGIKHSYFAMTFTFFDGHVDINMNGYIKNILTENQVKEISASPADSSLFEVDDANEAL
jgi:prepilin-type processing-associated H-X9-DG protein